LRAVARRPHGAGFFRFAARRGVVLDQHHVEEPGDDSARRRRRRRILKPPPPGVVLRVSRICAACLGRSHELCGERGDPERCCTKFSATRSAVKMAGRIRRCAAVFTTRDMRAVVNQILDLHRGRQLEKGGLANSSPQTTSGSRARMTVVNVSALGTVASVVTSRCRYLRRAFDRRGFLKGSIPRINGRDAVNL